MSINEIICQTCADAGLPQRSSWNTTQIQGILVCNQCQHQTDARKQHALLRGRNKWFKRVTIMGKPALRCNADGKWALSNWTEAKNEAFKLGKRAYYSHECGNIHLATAPLKY